MLEREQFLADVIVFVNCENLGALLYKKCQFVNFISVLRDSSWPSSVNCCPG